MTFVNSSPTLVLPLLLSGGNPHRHLSFMVSNAASLPEVTGEAAIKVNPYDTDSITSALREILTDERLKRELVSKGFERESIVSPVTIMLY